MAPLNETRAPTFRNYVAEQGVVMPSWSKPFQSSWSHSSVFALQKLIKNLNFQSFFTSKSPLVATFNEMRASTSRKYVAEQGIVMPNWWKTFQNFLLHFSVFALEKLTKNLNF